MGRKVTIGSIVKRISNLIYPPDIYCICCGRPVESGGLYSLCSECLENITWANGKLCRICGKLLEDWYPDDICGECKVNERSFDSGISCFQYNDQGRSMIRDFKYHGKSYMARTFAEIAADKIMAVNADESDVVIPVPMYYRKERRRGYNQASVLAGFLADMIGSEFRNDILIRVEDTVPMNKLGAKERRRNLEGAFRLRHGTEKFIAGKKVLLVDDIYTTGSTAEFCSRVLKKAGSGKITVLSLASGRNQRPLPDVIEYIDC